MPWSAGTFTRTNGVFSGAAVWLSDKLAGTKITSAHHDTHDEDLADGINNCMAKDGTNAATAALNMGGFRVTNVADGINGDHAANLSQLCHYLLLAVGDETTALTTGTEKYTVRLPYAISISSVKASLSTGQTSGSLVTVDINQTAGIAHTSILSTAITIDNGERTSLTAVTQPVIDTSALLLDTEITIDIDQVGDGTAKGLKVYLIGQYTT